MYRYADPEILLESRMERAKQLLIRAYLPVATVADMLGYGSSNFYKAFRQYFGTSPRGCSEMM